MHPVVLGRCGFRGPLPLRLRLRSALRLRFQPWRRVKKSWTSSRKRDYQFVTGYRGAYGAGESFPRSPRKEEARAAHRSGFGARRAP